MGAASAHTADTVSIGATPSIVGWPGYTTSLGGTVSSGQAGQAVTIEQRACGDPSFQAAATTRTTAGGTWNANMPVSGKTIFRARWRGARSSEVTVLSRPHITIGQIDRRTFRALLTIGTSVNGKRLLLQRFDADERSWKTVKAVRFGGKYQLIFEATVPKGTTLRLTLPRAEALPCYLAGYSNVLQT